MELAAQFASTRENSPGSHKVRFDRLTAVFFFDSTGGAACSFSDGGVICLVYSVSVYKEKREDERGEKRRYKRGEKRSSRDQEKMKRDQRSR